MEFYNREGLEDYYFALKFTQSLIELYCPLARGKGNIFFPM